MIRLRIKGELRWTLESTNACESIIDTVRTTQRNVKHYPVSPSRSNTGSTFTSPHPATTQEAAIAVTM